MDKVYCRKDWIRCLISPLQNQPRYQKEKGSGLGLLICKELTEKMDGTLSVESEQNRGTTVSFTLPLQMLKKLSLVVKVFKIIV
ncbi:MAG: hypothetical protein IPG53_16160 [Ignavibacteriales bacterium]|nr:hypothetical protein [Ignavibacteriales bacterium]